MHPEGGALVPTRHLFSAPDATHGRTLCGLDVKAPEGERKPRTLRDCVPCQNQRRKLDREAPVRNGRRSYHDRLAED